MDGVTYAGGMTSDPDDALSWDGDDEPTSRHSRPSKRRTSDTPTDAGAAGKPTAADDVQDRSIPAQASATTPFPLTASGAASGLRLVDVDALDEDEAEEPVGLSTVMLLTLGVIGGIYLLYSVGWVVGGLRLQPLARFFVVDAMFLPWFVLAIAAPALWFLAAWVLTRGRATWIRISALVLGVILLVPWPFVTVGAIG